MSSAESSELGEGDDERTIDRSGDIDQRPPEERPGAPSNVVVFSGSANLEQAKRQVKRSLISPIAANPIPFPSSNGLDTDDELASVARRLQRQLDAQFAKAKSQLET